MEEPVYTYIKGQGWVIRKFNSVECCDLSGRRIKLEFRTPEIGEYYNYHHEEWPISEWVEWASNYPYNRGFSFAWTGERKHLKGTQFAVCILL